MQKNRGKIKQIIIICVLAVYFIYIIYIVLSLSAPLPTIHPPAPALAKLLFVIFFQICVRWSQNARMKLYIYTEAEKKEGEEIRWN